VPYTTHLEGLDEWDRETQQVAALLLDLRTFWPSVVPLFIGWMRAQFDTQGAFMGDPWAPLSPAYAAWKAIKYPGKPILQAEGDLRQAASSPRRETTPQTLTLTIADPKAGYHQDGTGRMPARPLVFDISAPATVQSDIDKAAEDWLDDILRRLR